MPIEVKNFSSADEAKDMPNARMEAVNVLNQRVMKLTLSPDWKWSKDIKPIIGTDTCQATHTGIIVEGAVHCVCDDGSEATYTAGDAYAISPGHDAWVVGGKPAIVYEFAGMWGEYNTLKLFDFIKRKINLHTVSNRSFNDLQRGF